MIIRIYEALIPHPDARLVQALNTYYDSEHVVWILYADRRIMDAVLT